MMKAEFDCDSSNLHSTGASQTSRRTLSG